MKKTILLLLVILLSHTTFSQSLWNGSWAEYTHGSGTEDDPYLIENAENLAYLAYQVNNGLGSGNGNVVGTGKHYKLTTDIDLNGSDNFQWNPIGYWISDSDCYYFGGNFDGNGHTILRLFINSSARCVGLFGQINGATIKKLTIKGSVCTTWSNTNLAGFAGGIVGYAKGTSSINNCSNYCTVYCGINSYSGGILGINEGSLSIQNCRNRGYIFSKDVSGGIVGVLNATSNIQNCYNTAEIKTEYSTHYRQAGGIAGNVSYGTTNITNCYNTGNIRVIAGNYSYQGSGGILGVGADNASAWINNCYNTGNISISGGTNSNAGGIVGSKSSGTVTNSYFLNTCGGNNTYGGETKTDVFMKDLECVIVLNNGSLTYKKDEQPYSNQGYPVFSNFRIETGSPSSVTSTSAVLWGNYASEVYNLTTCGFEYKKVTDQNYIMVNCEIGQTPYSFTLSNLNHSTTYQYRAFVTAPEGTAYGSLVEFTTAAPPTYIITASVLGEGGTINPSGTITIYEGESRTFNITPNQNHIIQSVIVDGESVGNVSMFTFENIMENHNIIAVFDEVVVPCQPPVNLQVNEVSDVYATLSWQGAANSYVIIYGKDGVYDQTITVTGTSVRLVGLQHITNYVWKVKAVCEMNESEYVQGLPFMTLGTGGDENEGLNVTVYPNPTCGKTIIKADGLKHITISNMIGQIIYKEQVEENIFEYDFSVHGVGLYLIRLETKNCVIIKKMIVSE